jgi:uncharacterized YigZ family protein
MKLTVKLDSIKTIEIKKSKFIGYAFFCADVEMANNYLSQIRLEHKKATHVCYAYIINSNEKASDDGEPQGTAGLPMLEILKKRKLTNVLVVAVRYFGGIKLGAGGLVRAYGETVSSALNESGESELKEVYEYSLTLNYGEETVLNNLKLNSEVYNLTVEYSDKITVLFCSNLSFENLKEYNLTKNQTKLIRV